jgi:hypothetical protein
MIKIIKSVRKKWHFNSTSQKIHTLKISRVKPLSFTLNQLITNRLLYSETRQSKQQKFSRNISQFIHQLIAH